MYVFIAHQDATFKITIKIFENEQVKETMFEQKMACLY
jgi:hypothetical protein